ncbi:MAG: metal-sensitive transcriptional regulator [Chloroflexi bacterium]|nr:metal-sensitive transcriptional regulator [Chloroflexota bacterium]
MHISPDEKVATQRRLKSVEGHVRGIARMIEDDAYCIDVIQQIRAVQAALDKVAALTLEEHLKHCVVSAVQGDDPAERARVLDEILTVFRKQSR